MVQTPPVQVGVAGLGFGSTEYLPALEKMPEISLVAAADLRYQAREAFRDRYHARTYESVEELCRDPQVEAIWVSTPEELHAEHSAMAARHGKHILIRKPMGLTMDECQRVLDEAAKTNVKILAGGQTQGTNHLVAAIRRMLLNQELGRLTAMSFWAYTGWMLSPRKPEEVDDARGGGIVWRQVPHQIETLRWLGGGLVRSVRAITGHWRPERAMGTGYVATLLELNDGTPVSLTYNAYGFFDTVELVTDDRGLSDRISRRKALMSGQMDEAAGKEAARFGALIPGKEGPQIPWEQAPARSGPRQNLPGNQGVFIVSCERGDIRVSPDGLYIYDEDGKREVPVPAVEGAGMAFLNWEALELVNAIRHNAPMLHDGRWGMATAEVQWAMLESARTHEEIVLKHQVAVPPGF